MLRGRARCLSIPPNIIYEIYNEPLDISWSETVKPYAISVITAIREIDPDNLIVVGLSKSLDSSKS